MLLIVFASPADYVCTMKAESMVARIKGSIGRCMVCVTLSLSAATFVHATEADESQLSPLRRVAATTSAARINIGVARLRDVVANTVRSSTSVLMFARNSGWETSARAIEQFASGRRQFAAGRAGVHQTVQLLLSENQLRLHLRDDLHFQCEVSPYRKPYVEHDVGVTFGLHYKFR